MFNQVIILLFKNMSLPTAATASSSAEITAVATATEGQQQQHLIRESDLEKVMLLILIR